MEPFTREQLQNLKTEKDIADKQREVQRWTRECYNMIKNVATTQNVTRYFIDASHYCRAGQYRREIALNLRNLFPGCIVEHRETTTHDGRIVESGIIVDWS